VLREKAERERHRPGVEYARDASELRGLRFDRSEHALEGPDVCFEPMVSVHDFDALGQIEGETRHGSHAVTCISHVSSIAVLFGL
jgi:hypothetical protein